MHTMKYSNIEFDVNIPEEQIACELESNVVELSQRTVKEHIEYALDNPIGAGDISTVVKKGDKVAIIISDVTRKWQAIPTYLPILVDRLNKCG
ncbi:lactate racemase domain-containing protein, partial [Intestinibacter sp.]|uniref:lactate racemase domain-containing protein n=1 Tax=Intestinibacter sp. TaxID=1965304 RepID=UPI003F139D41